MCIVNTYMVKPTETNGKICHNVKEIFHHHFWIINLIVVEKQEIKYTNIVSNDWKLVYWGLKGKNCLIVLLKLVVFVDSLLWDDDWLEVTVCSPFLRQCLKPPHCSAERVAYRGTVIVTAGLTDGQWWCHWVPILIRVVDQCQAAGGRSNQMPRQQCHSANQRGEAQWNMAGAL